MLRVAHWDGLYYYLYKEGNPERYIVQVQDEEGKKAFFNLENANMEYNSQIYVVLSNMDIAKAQRMIQDFQTDFLDYWYEVEK